MTYGIPQINFYTALFSTFDATGSVTSKVPFYASIHYALPTTGTSNQISGTTRQLVTWGTTGSNSIQNNNSLSWSGLTNVTISHVGIYSALTGGNLLFTIALSDPVVIGATSTTYNLNNGGLFISFEPQPLDYTVDGGTPSTVFTTPAPVLYNGGTP
jgi:hypothetical protein